VGLSVSGRGAGSGHLELLALMVGAGLLIAIQQALNGRVRRETGHAGVATLVNFLVGTAALALAYAAFSDRTVDHWPGVEEGWLYIGGVLGVLFIAMAAVVVRTLGVLRLGLATVAGQLVGAIALDAVVPTPGHGVTLATLLGALLTFVAVGLSGRPPRAVAAVAP
jgi:transporter family-2 protein